MTSPASPENGSHKIAEPGLYICVIGQGLDHRGADGAVDGHAPVDQLGAVNDEAGGDAFFEVLALHRAELVGKSDEGLDLGLGQPGFAGDDGDFVFGFGEGEFQRDKALAGRGFEGLQDVLVAGVVGGDEEEVGVGFQLLARPRLRRGSRWRPRGRRG
jgi:hypothetical protein